MADSTHSSPPQPDSTFWKQKLAAYLHDPPSKCVDIRRHEEHAKSLYSHAGFASEDEIRGLIKDYTEVDKEGLEGMGGTYAKPSDWTASSADRFPFPKSRGNISSVFDGVRAGFHHPLSSDSPFTFHKEFQSAEMALEVDATVQPIASDVVGWSVKDQWKARFFCHWRLWEKFTTEKDYRFAFLTAETRLPDHNVWSHMQVVSALDGCSDGAGKDAVLKPAFLKFQLGPVQDFIAEARSVRDLWSGSYLLSWLMAAGMKALADEIGPDSVIFPNLKGQPLFDLHLRGSLWNQVKVNGKSVWDHLAYENKALLTPNLPNVFLAVVHRDRAKELGQLVEDAIRKEWKTIATSVWEFCEKAGMIPDKEAEFTAKQRKTRFDAQVARFLSIAWQATPWEDTLDQTLSLANSFDKEMPIQKAAARVRAIVDYATQTMPYEDRDGRYYVGGDHGPKNRLNNIGLGWSVILAYNGWQLDAVRQTRAFDAWSSGGWETGTFSNKDSLGGKAEAVAGGHEWSKNAEAKGGAWKSLFKQDDWLGATTLIKRLWHLAYLRDEWDLKTDSSNFPMPNTHGIAKHDPFSSGDDEDEQKLAGEKYFAVLALDGDEIGKWVSGEKTPAFRSQFSSYLDGSGKQHQGALPYFEANNGTTLLDTPRALSPSYHLQFSQALSNFALLCARPIVDAHKGRLIYAGGDEVLALLPADTAFECAQALRKAFQGHAVKSASIASPKPGYLSIRNDQTGHPIPFVVPGPAAEVSVGIAIAHFKFPLQDVVRAAQSAEKRAKNQLGRAAVAVSLFKRSGEITEWGTKWESGGLALYKAIAQALDSGDLSGKFPHRVCQLLEPYLTTRTGLFKQSDAIPDQATATELIQKEFSHAAERQGSKPVVNRLHELLGDCLNRVAQSHTEAETKRKEAGKPPSEISLTQTLITALIGLCTTVAFAHRTTPGNQSSAAEKQPAA